jgi:hypothetical protein
MSGENTEAPGSERFARASTKIDGPRNQEAATSERPVGFAFVRFDVRRRT